MAEGRADGELDLFWLSQDDAWERTSRLLAMIHNTTRSSSSDCKPPTEFNDLARWLKEGASSEDSDDDGGFGWIEAEERKKKEAVNGQ